MVSAPLGAPIHMHRTYALFSVIFQFYQMSRPRSAQSKRRARCNIIPQHSKHVTENESPERGGALAQSSQQLAIASLRSGGGGGGGHPRSVMVTSLLTPPPARCAPRSTIHPPSSHRM